MKDYEGRRVLLDRRLGADGHGLKKRRKSNPSYAKSHKEFSFHRTWLMMTRMRNGLLEKQPIPHLFERNFPNAHKANSEILDKIF